MASVPSMWDSPLMQAVCNAPEVCAALQARASALDNCFSVPELDAALQQLKMYELRAEGSWRRASKVCTLCAHEPAHRQPA